MPVLNEDQRRKLEKTVERAREVAEEGARAAIEQLAVQRPEPFPHLSPDERDLRNRLRARARQLGDTRDARTREHKIEHLVVECAYEHWHRMLFARFLAENNVLMHPDGVAVTLEECEELAPEEGAEDGWELAAWYAAEMLPQIFRPDSPIFELKLPPEKNRRLERLLADLPPEVFTANDSLGWVYQFWQSKKKDAVNKSEVKIGADELPAVTQLFTEPYMVQFLLHNTLGAWWAGRHGRESLPFDMPYLRILDDGSPAAGSYEAWPSDAANLRILDPCCGSGHFLVAAFELLVHFRMVLEDLHPRAACDAVLRENLFGLELDERCTQIAAFALALAAWTFPEAGGYRPLPEIQIACSGVAPRARKDEWLDLAGDDLRLRNGMERLHELFQDAPVLGSLIDPATVGVENDQHELGVAAFEHLRPLLSARLSSLSGEELAARGELGVAAKGIAAAAAIAASNYSLVVTNVPYLTRRRQCDGLRSYCEASYPRSKHELAFVFLERSLRWISDTGTTAVVMPDNWTSLRSYAGLRKQLLRRTTFGLFALLGEEAWNTFGIRGPRVTVCTIQGSRPPSDWVFRGIDASRVGSLSAIRAEVLSGAMIELSQHEQLSNPGSRVVLSSLKSGDLLEAYAKSYAGILNGDSPRYQRLWWEIPSGTAGWVRQQTTTRDGGPSFSGYQKVLWFDEENGHLRMPRALRRKLLHDSDQRGNAAWGRRGVAISQLRSLTATHYLGNKFDSNVAVIVPNDQSNLAAIWCYCSSEEYRAAVRRLDSKKNVTNATLAQVPFDLERWQKVARQQFPDGLPEPSSRELAEWLFNGGVGSAAEPLQYAVCRLLGFRWPDEDLDELDELVDDDGIVCLPAVRGEQPAANRLRDVLVRAHGGQWSVGHLGDMLSRAGCKGWSLDRWLRERFFQQHCKLFQNRPFIWHVWDGIKKDGFSALLNYHKLDRKLLETLTYNYLGDWIRRQQDGVKRAEDGASERLVAAEALQTKLRQVLAGAPPCDIFVRWKKVEEQPIGWSPDLNDGVRVNIRPFMLVGDVGKKGAGILRDKPSITWGKDRGRDPAGAPWYDLGPESGGKKGDRINEHHLTVAEKQAARDEAGGDS